MWCGFMFLDAKSHVNDSSALHVWLGLDAKTTYVGLGEDRVLARLGFVATKAAANRPDILLKISHFPTANMTGENGGDGLER